MCLGFNTLKRNFRLVLLTICALFHLSAAAISIPKQFESDNAAVILGLQNKKSLTKDTIQKSARKLLAKYHPDRFTDSDLKNTKDREKLTEVTKKIILAKNALIKYIEANPDYDPSQPTKASGSSAFTGSSHKKQNYSWQDIFNEPSKPQRQDGRQPHGRNQVVTEQYYGDGSFNGTIFEFLKKGKSFQKATLVLEGLSPNLSENYDLILILNPETFPQIEVRVIAKDAQSDVPQLIEGFTALYERGGYHSAASGKSFDTIRFPDGRFLLEPSTMIYPTSDIFYTESVQGWSDQMVMIRTQMKQLFIEMNTSNYSNGRSFLMQQTDHQTLLPNSAAPEAAQGDWKALSIKAADSVILLGYDPALCSTLLKE